MLSKQAARDLAGDLEKEARPEWARLRKFVRYSRGKQKLPWLPDSAESEYRDIAQKSASNWLDLVVRSVAQGLHVDGYGPAEMRVAEMPENTCWNVWQDNNMDALQHALHRAVGTLGYSYLLVFPGEDPKRPWMRPDAGTSVYARFADPTDEFPSVAYRLLSKTKTATRAELYDAEARYLIEGTGAAFMVTTTPHPFEVCPVVRMEATQDLLGTPMGDVEPVIPIQDRIVDATFTLQMVAKYGAFPQRWIAGMNPGEPLRDSDGNPVTDSAGNPVYPTIKAYVDSILLAADENTKFGQFQAADLEQYVKALEAHIRHLSAISQVPPHYLLGSMVNLSAEALAAAEAGLQRKVADRQDVLGEGYEKALRLGALAAGDELAAEDTASQIHWQDVESRSLAQVADALVKLAGIGVPLELLFRMIPKWTETDVKEAMQLVESRPGGLDALVAELRANAGPDLAVA